MSAPAPEEGCRPATIDDVERVSELAEQAVAELRLGRGGELWARHQGRLHPVAPRLALEVTDPDHRVVVGTVDETVMAYGVARLDVLRDGSRLGVVSDLYTEAGARQLGIGELMMTDLVDWCRAAGCFGVDSLALPGDRHTKNFFESFGLVARAIVVHRSLS